MTTATTTRDVQIKIAYEVLMMDETGKTKKAIADEYGVSSRSVTRYAEKFEDEAMDMVTGEVPEENKALEVAFESKAEETSTETEEETTNEESSEEQEEETAPEVEAKPKRQKRARDENGLTKGERECLERYYKQKADAENMKFEERKGKTGRAKKGVKTIRFITMEIIETHVEAKTFTKENKDEILAEIMDTASVDEKTAKQYLSIHKKMFGDWQE